MTTPDPRPTPAQARVLHALHRHSRATAELLAQAKEFDGPAPESWLIAYHHHAVTGEDLTAAATAGGIPPAWITQARTDGEHGTAWPSTPQLAVPSPTDWDRILTDLSTDVARIQQWEALEVAYRQLRPDEPVSPQLRSGIEALRMHTAAVANLLGLTGEDGAVLWGDASDWARNGAAPLHEATPEQIIDRHRIAVAADTRAHGGQATALAVEARIPGYSPALASTHAVGRALATELAALPPSVTPATAVDMAVDAALSAPLDKPAVVVFSDAGADQPPAAGPGYDQPVPLVVFSADGAGW